MNSVREYLSIVHADVAKDNSNGYILRMNHYLFSDRLEVVPIKPMPSVKYKLVTQRKGDFHKLYTRYLSQEKKVTTLIRRI